MSPQVQAATSTERALALLCPSGRAAVLSTSRQFRENDPITLTALLPVSSRGHNAREPWLACQSPQIGILSIHLKFQTNPKNVKGSYKNFLSMANNAIMVALAFDETSRG